MSRPPQLPAVADVDVVEVDVADAGLLAAMRAAFMPRPIACDGVSDIGKPQAAPLRQAAAALSGKLPRQHDFLAASVIADDVRAEFAIAPVIAAHDLLFTRTAARNRT